MTSPLATLDRLEAETRSHHVVADRVWESLLVPDVTQWQYARRLVWAYGFEAPVEAAIAYTPHVKLLLDLRGRFRSGLIVQDLLELGLTASEIAELPQCSPMAPFGSPLEALGWLYVLKRSILVHGRVREHLVARLPDAKHAVAYLSAYRGIAHARLRELGNTLDRVVRSPRMLDEVVVAANTAFRCFERWSDDEQVPHARGACVESCATRSETLGGT